MTRYESRSLLHVEQALFESMRVLRGETVASNLPLVSLALLAWQWWGEGPVPGSIAGGSKVEGTGALSSSCSLWELDRGLVARGEPIEYVLECCEALFSYFPVELVRQASMPLRDVSCSDEARRVAVSLYYELLAEQGDGSARQELVNGVGSQGLNELLARLVKASRPERVLNPTSGSGALAFALACQEIEVRGIEVNPALARLSEFLFAIAGVDVSPLSQDALQSVPWCVSNGEPYDAVVIDPPWGGRSNADPSVVRRLQTWIDPTVLQGKIQTELTFLLAGLASSPRSTVICLMPTGPLFAGGKARQIREAILRDSEFGLQAVVSLRSMHSWTRVDSNIVVLSREHRGRPTWMIDAGSFPERFLDSSADLSSAAIEEIVQCFDRGCEAGGPFAEVSVDEILNSSCSWIPRRYRELNLELRSEVGAHMALSEARERLASSQQEFDHAFSALGLNHQDGYLNQPKAQSSRPSDHG